MQLRDWRKKHGLTQQALAEALGLTNSAITKYEKGAQRPRAELATRIESFTRGEVTAASLLGLAEPKAHKRGVREDAAGFDGSSRLTVEVPLSAERAKVLKDNGFDIQAIARAGAEKALKEAEAKVWAETNREAIDAYNIWIEKHGTLAEQFGMI